MKLGKTVQVQLGQIITVTFPHKYRGNSCSWTDIHGIFVDFCVLGLRERISSEGKLQKPSVDTLVRETIQMHYLQQGLPSGEYFLSCYEASTIHTKMISDIS